MELEKLILQKNREIAILTLNRPEALNALNRKLITQLITVLQYLDEDDSIKVVILKGAGRAFCAGMDLKDPIGGGVLKDIIATYGPWQALWKILVNQRQLRCMVMQSLGAICWLQLATQ